MSYFKSLDTDHQKIITDVVQKNFPSLICYNLFEAFAERYCAIGQDIFAQAVLSNGGTLTVTINYKGQEIIWIIGSNKNEIK